ncbi:hypothetical protein KKHLCK_00110 [Candidatus Electrothrix laxa]
MSSYEKIQFIGHSINTGPQLARDGFRERTVYTGDKDPVVDLGNWQESCFLQGCL